MSIRLAFLGLAMSVQVWGQAPTQWVLFDDISAPFEDILSDGDRMLGVGYEGLIAASGDGVGWTRIPSGTRAALYGILHTGAGYLAYGDSGMVLTSPDGVAWTRRQVSIPGLRTLRYGAFGNGTYVLIDNYDQAIASKDGVTWTASPTALTGKQGFFRSFAFGAGRFLVAGDRSLQESTDGITWTDRSANANLNIYSLVRGDSVFLASAATATGAAGIYRSADGLAWTRIAEGFPSNVLRYSNRGYLSAGSGRVDMSSDGVTWTTAAAGTDNLFQIAAAKGGFAASGSDLVTSANGTDWTPRKFGDNYSLNAIAYGNGRFVAVGDWSGMQMSPDGTLWTTLAHHGSGFFKSVTYANNLFVATGESGRFATSPDGDTWTTDSVATTQDLGDVAYGSAGFVAIAYNWPAPNQGSVWGSADGKVWSNLVPHAGLYRAIAFGGGRYVAVGFQGVMAWSSDGKIWNNAAALAKPQDFTDVTFGGGLFAAVGMNGAIATSPDGAAWTDRTTDTQASLYSVVHNGSQFIAIGGQNVLRISADGTTWAKGTSPQGVGTAIAYGGGRHVMISGSQSLSTGDAMITAGIRPIASPRARASGGSYFEARTGAWLALPATRAGGLAVVRLRNLQGRTKGNLVVTVQRGPGVSLQGIPPGLYLLDMPRANEVPAAVLRVTP